MIKEICTFLALRLYGDYLKKCPELRYQTPHKTRFDYEWSGKHITLIQDMMRGYPWFNGYSYRDQDSVKYVS